MRADRLLSILLLLQVHRRLTARDLAARMEVSERTILRDMNALSAAGVPVVAERGVGGGWGLQQPYRTNLTGLNSLEIRALFFARPSRLLAELGLAQAGEAALVKLLASLPEMSRQGVARTRERLHIDGAGWYESGESFPWLPVVQEAVWQDRQLQMTYQRADGAVSERLVDPLGLVAKGNLWYLVAASDGDYRSFRVSRIRHATITDTGCRRPEDFDLAAYWKRSLVDMKTGLPSYPAVVRVAPDLLARLRRTQNPRIESEAPPDADGWTRLNVMFELESEAHDYILRSAPQIEALEPLSLRVRLRETAERLAALHATPE